MEDKDNIYQIPAELEDLINKVDIPHEGIAVPREDGTIPTLEEQIEITKGQFRKMYREDNRLLPAIIKAVKLKISPPKE